MTEVASNVPVITFGYVSDTVKTASHTSFRVGNHVKKMEGDHSTVTAFSPTTCSNVVSLSIGMHGSNIALVGGSVFVTIEGKKIPLGEVKQDASNPRSLLLYATNLDKETMGDGERRLCVIFVVNKSRQTDSNGGFDYFLDRAIVRMFK